MCYRPPTVYEPLDGNRAYVLALDETALAQPAFGRIDSDMDWNATISGRHRQDNKNVRWSMVDGVNRNHQAWTTSSLFSSAHWFEVEKPHVTT